MEAHSGCIGGHEARPPLEATTHQVRDSRLMPARVRTPHRMHTFMRSVHGGASKGGSGEADACRGARFSRGLELMRHVNCL